MKWRNHAIMAGSISFMMGLHPVEILYCVAGANLPDQLEKVGKYRLLGHRTWTHELLLWLLPLLLLLAPFNAAQVLPRILVFPTKMPLREYLVFRGWVLLLPGIFHLAGDIMTPRGIQIATKKLGLGLFRTGQPVEYLVAGLFALAAICFKGGWM